MSYIGIDKGGTRHTYALADAAGEILLTFQRNTPRDGTAKQEIISICSEISGLIADGNTRFDPVSRIAISFGGPVDASKGETIMSHHIVGWEHIPICAIIEEKFNIPVVLDNDANCGALAEWKFGAGVGIDDLVYINVGTGIGGGVVANGKLVRGAHGVAGEIGHIVLNPNGPACTCERHGCLESYASGRNIERRYCELTGAHESISGQEIFARAAEGEKEALAIIWETAEYLAHGISLAVGILDPDIVIIGGGLSEAGILLFGPLDEALARYVIPQMAGIKVVPAKLGYECGVIGAIALAMHVQ